MWIALLAEKNQIPGLQVGIFDGTSLPALFFCGARQADSIKLSIASLDIGGTVNAGTVVATQAVWHALPVGMPGQPALPLVCFIV